MCVLIVCHSHSALTKSVLVLYPLEQARSINRLLLLLLTLITKIISVDVIHMAMVANQNGEFQ